MEAFGAFMVSLLPYIAPIIGALLVYLAGRLTKAIESNQNAGTAAKAAGTFAFKAATVVRAIEQKNKAAFEAACADGKITADEARQLAALAVKTLLETAAPDLDAMGIADPATRESIASAAIESEVFALPKRNRIVAHPVVSAITKDSLLVLDPELKERK